MKINVLWAAALMVAAASPAFAQSTPKPSSGDGEVIGTDALVKAACEEGSVNYYTGQTAQDERIITAPFTKLFPCIKVNITSEVSGRLYERIRTETTAGKIQGDVGLLTDPQITQGLIDQKTVRGWTPPAADKIPAEGKLPGYWYAAIGTSFYPIYNTDQVKEADAPKTWKDLLDPKYKGHLATSPISVGGTGWIQNAFMKFKLGDDYLKAFYAQQPRLLATYTEAATAVARGEFPVGIVASVNDFPIRTAQGGPIKPIYPPEGVPFIPFEMLLFANSPHPHAAELFANWYLSKEGQVSVVNERGAYSWRADVPTAAGAPSVEKLKVYYPGIDFITKEHDGLIAEVNALVGGH